jgi:hypothetical protein
VHTCDMRHSKTWIHAREPLWAFETGFTETDELWTADDRETDSAQQARAREALVWIFDNDPSTCERAASALLLVRYADPSTSVDISVTAHSGLVGAMLRAIGHRAFSLSTGGEQRPMNSILGKCLLCCSNDPGGG